MMRRRSFLQLGVPGTGIGLLMVFSSSVFGVVVALDAGDPNDPAYVDGWEDGDNGGTGFGAWGGVYGNPVETATDVPEPDNNLGATTWFRLGTGGFGYGAARSLDAPIQPGQSFEIDFDQFAFSGSGEFQTMIRLGTDTSGPGGRVVFWNYVYLDNNTPLFGSSQWYVGATTANNNLNGGNPLPTEGCYGFCSGYSIADSTDGFKLQVDILTADTYRLRVFDDNGTKVDVSGQMEGPVGGGIAGLYIWSADGTGATIDTSYFTNMKVETTPGPALVAGDYNGNGVVDGADYVVWRDHKGLTGSPTVSQGNGDADGDVDDADYAYWRTRFGNTSGGGSGLGAGTIPEPSTCLLIVMACTLLARARRAR